MDVTPGEAPADDFDANVLAYPPLTRESVDACAFQNWFPRYRRITPKATVLDLPEAFSAYLIADGVFLPSTADDQNAQSGDSAIVAAHESSSDSDENSNDEVQLQKFDFQALTARIEEVIAEYGAVFPKLNWSSPQDAAWITAGQSLKCTNAEEVYLLLKASDFVLHDVEHAYQNCVDASSDVAEPHKLSLVLKKWFAMPTSHEFRCFVRQRELLAISQRDNNFYPFLQETPRKAKFMSLISDFYKANLFKTFSEEDYVFDVYITRDEDKVFLIDIAPFGWQTDALLFSWGEILAMNGSAEIWMRIIETQRQASQSMPRFSHNRYPQEVVGLTDGNSIANFAKDCFNALDEFQK